MSTIYMLHSLFIGGFTCLAYLLVEFRNRAVGVSKRKDSLFKEVPGWPLVGQLPEILWEISRPFEAGAIRTSKFGPGYSITVPGVRIVDVSKPEWIEYVQKTNFNNYVKGPLFRSLTADLFGENIIVTDGELWKKNRQVISRVFHVNTFKTLIEPCSDKSIEGLLRVLKNSSKQNQSVNFCELFTRFTLDSFVAMTFGKALGLFEDDSTGSEDARRTAESFSRAFDFTQRQVDFRFTVVNGWDWYETINFPVGLRMKNSCRLVHNYAYNLIDERLANFSSGKYPLDNDQIFDTDFLGLVISTHHQRGSTLNREELRDSTLSFLLAGRDATAQSLTWCFFHLIKNKELISKIRHEAANRLGNDLDDQARVTYENYRELVLTNACILEATRLHPPVPKNLKFAVADDKIPGGPIIEPGDCLSWSDWEMARNPLIWGPDCANFKPDRWIDETGKLINYGKFKFHSFNGGPRLCPGMNLAIFLSVKTIVEIFQHFDLDFAEGWLEKVPKNEVVEGIQTDYPTPQYQASLTMPMKFPMMISLKPRSDQM